MSVKKGKGRALAVIIAIVVIVAASIGVYEATKMTGRGQIASTGYLTVAAQDPGPIAGVEFVYVEATQIQVHNVNGSWITVLDRPTQVKLNYVLNTTAAFATAKIPAGSYDMVRIIVPSGGVKVTVNTSVQPLPGVSVGGLINVSATVPSGAQTGIKIYTNFTLQPGATYTLILHFHLVETGKGNFLLTPQTNAQTETSSAEFVKQLFTHHLESFATDNTSTLSGEYTQDANTYWDINITKALAINQNITGQAIASNWSKIYNKLNITGYTTSVMGVNLSGNLAQVEGYINFSISLQGKTYFLTLVDKATYVYNGQVWLINSEELTQTAFS
ncbi:MAG: DUF4382 domain-containing protein [Thermoprotei archaeon]